jgi:hypothetical protein
MDDGRVPKEYARQYWAWVEAELDRCWEDEPPDSATPETEGS